MKPFVRLMTWARKQFGSRQSRPVRCASIVLERLEERCVTAVVAGVEWPSALGTGSASWTAAGRTALMSGASEANRPTGFLPAMVPPISIAGRDPASQFHPASVPAAESFPGSAPHSDSIRRLDAIFSGLWLLQTEANASAPPVVPSGIGSTPGRTAEQPSASSPLGKQNPERPTVVLPSGSRGGGLAPSVLNPLPPAPEDHPSVSWTVSGPDATGSGGTVFRSSPADPGASAPSDNVQAPAGTALEPAATPSVSAGYGSASALSQLNCRVNRFQFRSGVVDFHLPIDTTLRGVDVVRPCRGFLAECGQVFKASVRDALAC
jgi:hypothetical protein